MQYIDAITIKIMSATGKAKLEDMREIIGILLSLLVIAAFIVIACAMAVPLG